MRYDNWDVIVFPKESATPIQEFRTACYTTQDEHGRFLPTLTCYIASLPTAAPFRISVHSWISPAKPSSLTKSHKKSNQKVFYTVQVIVDGTRLFHGFYDATSSWPQEIGKYKAAVKRSLGFVDPSNIVTVNEKRSAADAISERGHSLEFPPFLQNVLMQRSWDAREQNGRIKVLLSEQVMGRNSSPGQKDYGFTNDIVCFAFQHAPQEILQQAGISWPIRNPLYLGSGTQASYDPQLPPLYMEPHEKAAPMRTRSALSQHSPSVFAKSCLTEPFARPSTNPPHLFSQFPKPMAVWNTRRLGRWDSSLEDSGAAFGSQEAMSTDSWPMTRNASHSIGDTPMPDLLYASPVIGHNADYSSSLNSRFEFPMGQGGEGKQQVRDVGAQQILVTLRDDQLGQLIEAISPPKKGCRRETGQHPTIGTFPTPSIMQGKSVKSTVRVPGRLSAAALARKVSYPELKISSKTSPNKETQIPQTMQENLQVLGDYPDLGRDLGRVPTPHPFTVPQAQMNRWDSDISLNNTSSAASSFSRWPYRGESNPSPVPVPTARGNIKSRKEGVSNLGGSSPPHARHDYNLQSQADSFANPGKTPTNTPKVSASHAHTGDIIDVDAIDHSFMHGHKCSVFSGDSTSCIERKLYSALGEELSFHGEEDHMADVETEPVSLTPVPQNMTIDIPVIKRKRQDTIGGERDPSPVTKLMREGSEAAQLGLSSDSPRLFGGVSVP